MSDLLVSKEIELYLTFLSVQTIAIKVCIEIVYSDFLL